MVKNIVTTSEKDSTVLERAPEVVLSNISLRDQRRSLLLNRLNDDANSIDAKGNYPYKILKDLGRLDTYNITHYCDGNSKTQENLFSLINFHSQIAEICLNTAFCVWCQTACSWYLFHTANQELKKEIQERIEQGEVLAGTGLSNPMKATCQIEEIRLKAREVPGGYRVNGYLPWVSNITEESFFGAVMSLQSGEKGKSSDNGNLLTGLIHCGDEGISINKKQRFVALNGSATVGVRLDNYFLPYSRVLAEDGDAFLNKIRPGFIYFQAAMGLGNIQGSLSEAHRQLRRRKNLPEKFNARYQTLIQEYNFYKEKASMIADCLNQIELQEILQLRLSLAYLSQEVASLLLVSAGAAGYLNNTAASRKIREAHFISIVTPSITQLEIMLAQTN